jgi:hypothetical protein
MPLIKCKSIVCCVINAWEKARQPWNPRSDGAKSSFAKGIKLIHPLLHLPRLEVQCLQSQSTEPEPQEQRQPSAFHGRAPFRPGLCRRASHRALERQRPVLSEPNQTTKSKIRTPDIPGSRGKAITPRASLAAVAEMVQCDRRKASRPRETPTGLFHRAGGFCYFLLPGNEETGHQKVRRYYMYFIDNQHT